MSDLLARLNPEQREAVTLPETNALILAGAGSGKTRVLTTRIAWLIQEGLVRPHGVLAVTFTNKAAREMLTRLEALLPINTRGMWIGTFHGLCNRMLRAHHQDAALPALFQILDTADQLAAIKRLLKSLNVDDQKFPARDLQYFINGQKEAGIRANAVEAWDDFTRRKAELYGEYERQCQREGVVDFAELLLRSLELLEHHEPIRHHYQQRFRHILVDEFQDTNPMQYRWLKLLAGGGASIFAVGDDDQSIYGFRGADVGNMRDFERSCAPGHLIRLEQNYRSRGNILDAANALIRHNSSRLGKQLWTDRGAGEPLRVFEALSDGDEARWIVEEIRTLIADGVARDELAILYRSNAQSRVLEHALFTAAIPYRVYGGLRFFERAEVKHALAYLRLLVREADDNAFLRVVNFPARGIGARSLENLQDAAAALGGSLAEAVPRLSGKAGASLGAFLALIRQMGQDTAGLPLPELVDHVLTHSGLRDHYAKEREGQERLENLDELVNASANFSASEGEHTLADFLAHAALEAGDNQADPSERAVQLMTAHAAKGLEFDVVFITGLEEGLFPHENSSLDPNALEEERRLMYVAITRARERLYLSHSQTRMLHGQTRYNLPSRFLDELPPSLLRQFGTRRSTTPAAFQPRATALRPPPPPRRDAGQGLHVGQVVRHARFGTGIILAAEGSGSDARVQVAFKENGTKWLALAIAKLTPA